MAMNALGRQLGSGVSRLNHQGVPPSALKQFIHS
jgi:hypothetical protein